MFYLPRPYWEKNDVYAVVEHFVSAASNSDAAMREYVWLGGCFARDNSPVVNK
jgi:hypothetical protein